MSIYQTKNYALVNNSTSFNTSPIRTFNINKSSVVNLIVFFTHSTCTCKFNRHLEYICTRFTNLFVIRLTLLHILGGCLTSKFGIFVTSTCTWNPLLYVFFTNKCSVPSCTPKMFTLPKTSGLGQICRRFWICFLIYRESHRSIRCRWYVQRLVKDSN